MEKRKNKIAAAFFAALLMLAPAGAQARGRHRHRAARAPQIPSVLRGSVDALADENAAADAAGLPRFQDRAELEKAIADGSLVPLADTDAYAVDGELGEEDPDNAELYAYTREWTKSFLGDVLGDVHRKSGQKFAVTSLVRTQEYQDALRTTNKAAADSKTSASRSTHLTGATVDLSLVGVSWRAKQLLRKRLIELEKRGLVRATEEHYQYCMHILVLPKYGDVFHPPDKRKAEIDGADAGPSGQ